MISGNLAFVSLGFNYNITRRDSDDVHDVIFLILRRVCEKLYYDNGRHINIFWVLMGCVQLQACLSNLSCPKAGIFFLKCQSQW